MPADPFVALVYFGAALLVFALVGSTIERYLNWRDFDRYRRLSRKAHVNLIRGLR